MSSRLNLALGTCTVLVGIAWLVYFSVRQYTPDLLTVSPSSTTTTPDSVYKFVACIFVAILTMMNGVLIALQKFHKFITLSGVVCTIAITVISTLQLTTDSDVLSTVDRNLAIATYSAAVLNLACALAAYTQNTASSDQYEVRVPSKEIPRWDKVLNKKWVRKDVDLLKRPHSVLSLGKIPMLTEVEVVQRYITHPMAVDDVYSKIRVLNPNTDTVQEGYVPEKDLQNYNGIILHDVDLLNSKLQINGRKLDKNTLVEVLPNSEYSDYVYVTTTFKEGKYGEDLRTTWGYVPKDSVDIAEKVNILVRDLAGNLWRVSVFPTESLSGVKETLLRSFKEPEFQKNNFVLATNDEQGHRNWMEDDVVMILFQEEPNKDSIDLSDSKN